MQPNTPLNASIAPDVPKTSEFKLISDPSFSSNFLYKESISNASSVDYKIPYAPTMETQIRKWKISLENYKEMIIQLNGLMLWEKPWHPYAIAGGCTIIFMLTWLSEPNILTVLSLLGLFITVGDYILPTLVPTLFKNEHWNNEKQKQFEEVCTNIVLYKTKLELLVTSYYRMRVTNPKMYFTITIAALVFLAWIGSVINNLFLTYLLVLSVLMLPGMLSNGMLNKTSDTLSKIFTDLVENAKSKVGQKKMD